MDKRLFLDSCTKEPSSSFPNTSPVFFISVIGFPPHHIVSLELRMITAVGTIPSKVTTTLPTTLAVNANPLGEFISSVAQFLRDTQPFSCTLQLIR